MATYATAQDVTDRYEGTVAPVRATTLLNDAEADLLDLVPGLADRASGSAQYAAKVRRTLAWAVIRFLRNPEGYTFESAGDRSVSRGAAAAASAGKVTFTAADIAGLLPAPDRSPGWRTVRTPRPEMLPSRYGYADGTLL